MPKQMPYPGVGTGVWIRKDGKVLLGKRKSAFFPNTWCIPGGKLEMYEAWDRGAEREAIEETGVAVQNMRLAAVLDDPQPSHGTHYISLHFVADWASGEARVVEPDKFEAWQWFAYNALPKPLFPSTANFPNQGYDPFRI